ncbi:uncharacterized protein LOC143615136 [Bidens hawaiensis]|uniref:uncharacterized protein LOC143615136 n=1 Tax=Bidens hawaiensis TaxID=980011 RepID=UPI00404A72FA
MSNSMLLFFFLSFIIFISPGSSSSSSMNTTRRCSVKQAHALILFKQNLSSINYNRSWLHHICEGWLGSGYKQKMINWKTGADCCDWNGVTCDRSTGDVIGLDLSCGMVQGTIHPNTTLFHLPRLQRLNLAYNNFTDSQFPPHISKLSNSLTHLNMSSCGFTGHIPSQITLLPKLVSLYLYGNEIDNLHMQPHIFSILLENSTFLRDLWLGEVNIGFVLPTYLNISSSLRSLVLISTGLQGRLPDNILSLEYLEVLYLSDNKNLSGPLPNVNTSTIIPLTVLDLSWTNISGEIPTSIGNLKYLTRLDLSSTSLSGEIPTSIGNLKSLTELDLSYTSLSGEIPISIGNLKSLTYLYLSRTSLSGERPTSIGNLKSLTELDLSYTSLSGEIPTSIGNLKYLTRLDLSSTSLSGEIPTSIGNLKYLTRLDLSSTSLSGEIPTSIGNLKSLTELGLSYTSLSGEIPISIGNLKSLTYLYLSRTSLSGEIPTSIGNLKYLTRLDLSSTSLSGEIPISIGNLKSLTGLYLSQTSLSGEIPISIGNLKSLTYLYLSRTSLSGEIPTSIGNFKSLTKLDLSYTSLSGEWELDTLLSSLTNLQELVLSFSGISVTTNNANRDVNHNLMTLGLASCSLKVFPASIRSMKALYYLDLSRNDIHGHIPDWVGEIGGNGLELLDLSNNSITGIIPNEYKDWGQLQWFLLNGNELEGKVPTSLNKCKQLSVIDLGNNHLNDTFPGWLGDLPNLQVLVLRSNNFHGGIVPSSFVNFPFPSLRVLDLSQNGFVGKLPTKYFQNFNAMKNVVIKNTEPEYLYIDGKYYSITFAMKGVDQNFPRLLVDYTIIDLSNNKFEGEIPNIIGNLNSLKALNLSHNSLTGRIPQALGNISEIESLDLSWNKLTGEIPQSLADVTFLEFLNLSQNHLMGHIPQGKQFNTFEGNSFGGNPKLCGFPLPKNCSERLHEPQLEGDGDEDESGFAWKVVMMGYICGILLGFVLGYLMLSTGRPKWVNAIVDEANYVIMKRQNKRR